MKTISVIIPTYNGEKTLSRAIKSIVSQTLICETEILICDDCSTDSTIEIAKSHQCKIIINPFHTGGPETGRNYGILQSKGEFIAFLDQDDEWMPDKLEAQFKQIDKGADVVYSQSKINNTNMYSGYPYLGSLLMKNINVPLFNVHYNPYNSYIESLFKTKICKEVDPCVIRYEDKKNLSFNPDFRKHDFYMKLAYWDNDLKALRKLYGTRARYFYYMGDGRKARFYFSRSKLTLKTILYIFTSYSGFMRNLVVKYFNVFA